MDDASTAGRTDDVVPVRLSRADRMLAVLKDGREHSREEILHRSPGGFFLTNNAASDLRRRGYDVRYRVKDGLRLYQLAGSLDAVSAPAEVSTLLPSVCVGDAQAADTASNEPGQLVLEVAAA